MKNNLSKMAQLKPLAQNRFVLFFAFLILFSVLSRIFSGNWLPSTETKDLWFYSGIFMVLFSILFIEPYYTSPKNVITNAIPLLLVFLSIKNSFPDQTVWWIAISIVGSLIGLSILAISIENKELSEDHPRNRVSIGLKNVVVFLGEGKVLFSLVFFYFLFTNYSIYDLYSAFILLTWAIIVLIDPRQFHNTFSLGNLSKERNQIGEIFGVQSKKIFLVKLYEDRKAIRKFDIVNFMYSMQDSEEFFLAGIIFDTYLLNQEKWAKVLQLQELPKSDEIMEKNVVYKITDGETIEEFSSKLGLDQFVGIVTDKSEIGKIKFEYSKKTNDLEEGDLLQLEIGGNSLFYQVVGGTTANERLEDRNEMGFIEGEAIQLGKWNAATQNFEKFGWVPSINTPVFRTEGNELEIPPIKYADFKLGVIPRTSIPAVINLDDTISHHLALIGITGCGKSFLAREIISEIKKDTKIIAVDFNKEFASELSPVPPTIIKDSVAQNISEKIDWINKEMGEFLNNRDTAKISSTQVEIKKLIADEIEAFMDDNGKTISIFELPDVTNTLGIFDYTKYFFRELFEIAKQRQLEGKPLKICVVLEEAHTVIPEWNFSGSGDKNSQSVVNSIGQITLQGRKYGIGFLVIAQRTANVSKTVLTQCNTIISFKAFDETSFNFLRNYFGSDLVASIGNLKNYHAIVAGKGAKSNIPLIVDLTR